MAIRINNPRYGSIFLVGDSLDDLRDIDTKNIQDGYAALIRDDLDDTERGGLFFWRPDSTLADDDENVIAPRDGEPGRWHLLAAGIIGPRGPAGGNVMSVGLFTVMAGSTIPSGTQTVETSGYRTLGLGRGRYQRDDTLVTTTFAAANPTWTFRAVDELGNPSGWKLVPFEDGSVSFDSFGAYRNGITATGTTNTSANDDYPAWQAMTAYLLATQKQTSTHPYYRHNTPVRFSGGAYRFNTRIEWKQGSITLLGESPPGIQLGGWGTIFQFAANVGGLILHDAVTNGTTNEVATRAAYGSVLEGIHFISLGGTSAYHYGLWVRVGGCRLKDLEATQWASDGMVIWGSSGFTGAEAGGPNHTYAENLISSFNNGSGFRIEGRDANASTFVNLIANNNGEWGIKDASFLGATFIGGAVDGNGYGSIGRTVATANTATSLVFYNGRRWGLVYGQEANAATTTPGTNSAVWYDYGVGTAAPPYVPTWASNLTFKSGGGAVCVNQNAPSVFNGLYFEGGQGLCQNAGGRALFLGGIAANGVLSGAGAIQALNGVPTSQSGFRTYHADTDIATSGRTEVQMGGFLPDARKFLDMSHSTIVPQGYQLAIENTSKSVQWQFANGEPIWGVTTPATTLNFGRASPVTNAFNPSRLFVGLNNSARQISFGENPPGGEAARGDIVFNTNVSAGGNVGWVCVAAGNPGTWKTFGAVAA